ncbi:hypothetical protein, partial [Klebsiella variicola]|uniref:hypothetical protein n=1 Tax=Klebsiella variicola TaxID=244366 RepID=UPI0039C316F4
ILSNDSYFKNETLSWELGADGSLLNIGSRSLKAAVGIGGRRDKFSSTTASRDPAISPVIGATMAGLGPKVIAAHSRATSAEEICGS